MQSVQPALPLIGRFLLAFVFLFSGVGKLAAPEMMTGYIQSAGLPAPEVALWLAVIVEIGGGLLLVAGYQTRLAAAALAVFTVVATFAFHTNLADQVEMTMFLKNAAILGGLLQVIAFGAGAYSLDNRRQRIAGGDPAAARA
jgi:putative oxidoreductase